MDVYEIGMCVIVSFKFGKDDLIELVLVLSLNKTEHNWKQEGKNAKKANGQSRHLAVGNRQGNILNSFWSQREKSRSIGTGPIASARNISPTFNSLSKVWIN